MSKKRKPNRKFQWGKLFLTALAVYLAVLFINQQVVLWKLNRQMEDTQILTEQENERRRQLEQKIRQLHSIDYVEKTAREELGLLKEGELPYMTIMPQQEERSR